MRFSNKLAFLLIFLSLILISCNTNSNGLSSNPANNEGEDNGGENNNEGEASHNSGLNCMNCHTPGGRGDGVFTIAGTIYTSLAGTTPFPGVSVRIYSQPNGAGTLLITLVSDANGNIHTGSKINLAGGAYPVITSPKGNIQHMPVLMTGGGCNAVGCHDGKTNPRAWVN